METLQEQRQKPKYTEPDSRYSMFYPKTKDGLLNDYPQLAKVKEFYDLRKEELLFVWYFFCKASPYYNIDDRFERAEKSVKKAFGSKTIETAQYNKCNFPDKISLAGEKMKLYEPGPRIRAKKLIEKIISDYEKMIGSTDVDDDENWKNSAGDIDMAKKKNYIELTKTVSTALTGLISQSEEGFGVSEIIDEDFEDGDDTAIEFYVGQK